MDIRNRMADVIKLRCNVCQGFLKLIIKSNWQERLYNIAKHHIENNSYTDKYIHFFEKMRDIGKENYIIDDMDVSAISTIILYNPELITKINYVIRDHVRQITSNRNNTDHSSTNESKDELYLRALLDLCNLREFVRAVDKFETSISDDDRLTFRNEYIPKIESLKNILDNERIELVLNFKRMDKDIAKILTSNNPSLEWGDTWRLYDELGRRDHDMNLIWEFSNRASDAGVKEAHISAAIHAQHISPEDFERKIYLAYKSLETNDYHYAFSIIERISSFLSEQSSYTLSNCLQEVVTGISALGFPVSNSDDGYLLWEGKRIGAVPPKKRLYIVNELLKSGKKIQLETINEIENYVKDGYPITQNKEGLYLWKGKLPSPKIESGFISNSNKSWEE